MAETKKTTSIKHIQINKSQSTMLGVVIGTTILVIFSLFATKALIVKGMYQRRAISARKQVVTELKNNYDSANKLLTQYKIFAQDDPNILGGTLNGTTNLDGSNPVIALDALPSSYDAPALGSSLEKILIGRGVNFSSLSVKDDPTSNPDQPTTNPTPQPMTFSFAGTTSFQNTYQLLLDFERSIRPFDVTTLNLSGTDNALTIDANVTTYYQPAKTLNLQPTQEVK